MFAKKMGGAGEFAMFPGLIRHLEKLSSLPDVRQVAKLYGGGGI